MKRAFQAKIDALSKQLIQFFHTDDVFWRNEIESNRLVAIIMFYTGVALAAAWVLNALGVFHISDGFTNSFSGWIMLELAVPIAICRYCHGERRWLKHLMMLELIVVLARIDSIMTFNVPLLMALPVVLSVRYYSRAFTTQVAALSALLFAASAWFATALGLGNLDMNYYYAPQDTFIPAGTSIFNHFSNSQVIMAAYPREYMAQNFTPKLMIFTVIAITCAEIAKRGHNMVLEQAEISSKSARIESELKLASDIQANMLPRLFPAFPEYSEFDLYATMDPAKEVGGDLYALFSFALCHHGWHHHRSHPDLLHPLCGEYVEDPRKGRNAYSSRIFKIWDLLPRTFG